MSSKNSSSSSNNNNNNNNNNNLSYPSHLSFAGNLTPEDIQELLGAMSGENHDAEPEAPSSGTPAAASNCSSGNLKDEGIEEDGMVENSRDSCESKDGDVSSCNTNNNSGYFPKDDISEDTKAQARSQRKRSREKQRRSDVNKQFADLTQLLKQIESEESADEAAKRRLSFNPTNRVDLIARTIFHLERLHDSNKKRKTEVESLQQQLEQSKKAGEDAAAKLKDATAFGSTTHANKQQFMMMVPMMVSPDGMSNPAAMPMMNPFMMQQGFASAPHVMPTSQAPAMMQPVQIPQIPHQPQQQQARQQPQSHTSHHPQQTQQPQTSGNQPQQAMQMAHTQMQQTPHSQMPFPSFPMAFPPNAQSFFQPQQTNTQISYMMPTALPNLGSMMPSTTPGTSQVVPLAAQPPASAHLTSSSSSSQPTNQAVNNSTSGTVDAGGANNGGATTGAKSSSSSGMSGGGGNLAHCA